MNWILVISMGVHVTVLQSLHGLHSASWQHMSMPPLSTPSTHTHMDQMRQLWGSVSIGRDENILHPFTQHVGFSLLSRAILTLKTSISFLINCDYNNNTYVIVSYKFSRLCNPSV